MQTKSSNPYAWYLSDLDKVPQNNLKVFSTFACGGGSTMGYKLAGYDVVGANDIDPQMRKHYEANLHPKLFIEAPVLDLATMDLPDELFNLDVLDGSPPCSTFSMAGSREKAWGKEKHFREGQAVQVLDDLFFDFLQVAERLKPKVVVAENVKGMIAGNAKGYVRAVCDVLKAADYTPQVFLINAAYCGVPQRRERVFICAVRNDVSTKKLTIKTDQKTITFNQATADCSTLTNKLITKDTKSYQYWKLTPIGKNFASADNIIRGKDSFFGSKKINPNKPVLTITAGGAMYHYKEPRHINDAELVRLGSFPDDYQFQAKKIAKYLIGMSVPPKMMQVVAEAIRDQWLT